MTHLMIRSENSDQWSDMAAQVWVFLNHEDGAKIRFSGDVTAARAFLQVLKTHCHGRWGLNGESPAAPAAVGQVTKPELPGLEEPPIPGPAETEFDPRSEVEPVEADVPSLPPSIFKTASPNGKRKSVRYSFAFRVILTMGGKSFRSHCQDISIGGMKLKHRPPREMWNQVCNVFIGSPFAAENIELKCKLIPDPQSPLRVRFVDASPASLKKLEDWILAAEKASKEAA